MTNVLIKVAVVVGVEASSPSEMTDGAARRSTADVSGTCRVLLEIVGVSGDDEEEKEEEEEDNDGNNVNSIYWSNIMQKNLHCMYPKNTV